MDQQNSPNIGPRKKTKYNKLYKIACLNITNISSKRKRILRKKAAYFLFTYQILVCRAKTEGKQILLSFVQLEER